MTKIYDNKPVSNKDWHKLSYLATITEGIHEEPNGIFEINGVAINATTTRNGNTYTIAELRLAANSLVGQPILKDHVNTVDSIVGRVTEAYYNEQEKRIDFTGRIVDERMKQMIRDKLITSVSVGAMVQDTEELRDDDGVLQQTVLKGLEFIELSLVAVPADPGAGFAAAMAESLKLKAELEQTKSLESKEDNLMKEEIKVQEKTEDTNTVVLEAISKLSDSISVLSEKVNALDVKVQEMAEEEELVEEPAEEEAPAEELAEDATEGELASGSEENISGATGFVVDRVEKTMYYNTYEGVPGLLSLSRTPTGGNL